MIYEVMLTANAEDDLDQFVKYLLYVKKNMQAARSLLEDFEETKSSLGLVAHSLAYCLDPRLKEQGYRRINFRFHRYFMLYRIENDTVIVDGIFHELQDFENMMRQGKI